MERRSVRGGRKSVSQATHNFPLLRIDDIVDGLNKLYITITVEELKKPNQAIITRIFGECCKFLMGLNEKDLTIPNFDGMTQLGTFPELHENSVKQINLFRATSQLMRSCGVKTFEINDLLKPKPEKLKVFLSGLINFAKFREDSLEYYSVHTERVGTLKEHKEKLIATEAGIHEEIAQLNSQLEAEQPEHAAEQKQYEESTRSIVALQQKGKNIKADNNKMKAACAELKPKTDEVEMDIQRLQQDMETLRSQIVESPERLENEIRDLRARIDKENAGTNKLKENLAHLMDKERERLKCVKTLNKCTVSLNKFSENIKKCKRESKALKQQKNNITILTAKLKELKATKAHMERRLTTCNNKIKAVDEALSTHQTENGELLHAAENEVAQLEKNTQLKRQKLLKLEEQVAKIRSQIAEQKARHKVTFESRKELFEKFIVDVKKYDQDLLSCIANES